MLVFLDVVMISGGYGSDAGHTSELYHPSSGLSCSPPVCLMTERSTPRRALASSVEDGTPRTPASSGALTPAPGRNCCSLLLLEESITSPGPQAPAPALELTSWEVASVRRQLLWSHLREPRSQVSLLNMIHSKY